MSNSSLYGNVGNVTVSSNNLTTLYHAQPGNVVVKNVPDSDFTTLYSTNPSQAMPTKPYGNANVEAFLNAGTDGANSVQNIQMSGNITVGGESNLGDVGNVHIDGGGNGYALITDGNGNLTWSATAGNSTPGGSNGWMQYNANGVLGGTNQIGINQFNELVIETGSGLPSGPSVPLLFGYPAFGPSNAGAAAYSKIGRTGGNILAPQILANSNAWLSANGFTGNGAGLSNLQVANITGLGNIATINLDGNVGNVLAGDGTWVELSSGGIPGGSNTELQFNNNGVFGGTSDIVAPGGNVSYRMDAAISGGSAQYPLIFATGPSITGHYQMGFANGGGLPGTGVVTMNRDGSLFANQFNGDGSGLSNIQVANITGLGNIATVNLDGNVSNVLAGDGTWISTGTAINANYANFAGQVVDATQSNITTLGNLTNVNLDGNLYTPTAVYADGIVTPVPGNYVGLADSTFANGYFVDDTNVSVTKNGHQWTFEANATFTLPGNVDSSGIFNGDGSGLSNIQVANITGLGNIATTNYDGVSTHVLYGNGTWANIPVVSNVANANYANFAGTAYSVAGSNVSGAVNLANYATVSNSVAGANVSGQVAFAATANSVAGANVSGAVNLANYATVSNSVAGANVSGEVSFAAVANSVSVANVSGIGNIATINIDGSSSNVLYGNGTWAAIPTVSNVANANYANYAGNAFSVAGANVTGTVANATYAESANTSNTAITVTASNQPNITSVGTLTDLTVTGNITGYANISGGYIFGDGSYLTGIGNLSAANGYWGSFYSNVSQTIASTTTAYAVTLNNSDPDSHGVYISSNSHINFQFAGTYNLQFSAQLVNTNNAIQEASIWLRKNGVNVPDTRGACAITDKQGGVNGQIIESWNYILKLNAGDYLELMWQAENTSVSMEYLPAGTTPTTPASPSIIVTAQQVTNVQPVELQGSMTGNIIGNGFSLINIASISSVDGITGASFTGNGAPLSNLTGANVTGAVAYATTANSVAVANVSGIGNIATINLDGSGTSVLLGNGAWGSLGYSANANFANFAGEAFSVSGGNVSGAVSLANYATVANSVAGSNVSGEVSFAATANSVAGANVSGEVELATYATTANSVAGANVSGEVSFAATANLVAGANVSGAVGLATYADTANSVAVANVSGIGNIATINLDGNVSNVLAGDGTWIDTGTAVTANYANYAGNAELLTLGGTSNIEIASTDGPININSNGIISLAISDTTTTVYGNLESFGVISGDGANISNIQVGNIVGLGNIATINLDGNVSNLLAGDGTWVSVPSTANANYANYAGNAFSVDVANVVGIGNIATINLDGSSSNVLYGNGAWASVPTSSPAGSNTQIQFNDGSVFGANANLTFDKTTNTLAVPNITGNLSGTATTANVALNANSLLSNVATTATVYPVFATSSTNGYSTIQKVTGITANLAANSITATTFVGALTGSATTAGTVTTSAQPNITSLGTLANLTVTTFVSADSVSANTVNGSNVTTNKLSITTGTSGSVVLNTGLLPIGIGSSITETPIIFTPTASGANARMYGVISNIGVGAYSHNIYASAPINGSFVGPLTGSATTAGTVTTAAQPNITSVGTLTSVNSSGNITGPNIVANTGAFYGNGAGLTHLPVANISGLGNIATINLTGSSTNVLYGNGVFAAATSGDANYANYAGNLISGTSLIEFSAPDGSINFNPNATTALSVGETSTYIIGNFDVISGVIGGDGANLSNIQVANITGLGNIATINLDGNVANLLAGDGTWVSAPSANYANFAGQVVDAAQANITSVGDLTSLRVLGNIEGDQRLFIGTGSSTLTNPTAVFQGSGATYTQVAAFNSTGTGSSDLVTYGNNGDDTNSWADIGFTGNTFSDPTYTVTGPGDGYFFTQGNASFGGNMVIATGAVGTTKDIIFATGGFLTGNIKARLYNANGTFSVTGNVTGGNLTTSGQVVSTVATGTAPFTVTSTTQVANLNVATAGTAGTVTTNAQPNITSTGTLTSLTVSGLSNVANVSLTKYTETTVSGGNTSTSILPNLGAGTIFNYTANSSFSFNGFTSPVAGQSGTIIITQDGTGNRVMSSTMLFAGGAKTLSTSAGAKDIICVFYDGTNYFASLSKGYV